MLDQTNNVPRQASEILGDLTGLANQLGSADGLSQLSLATSSLSSSRVENVAGLENFLDCYRSRILGPHGLPAVAQAFGYATRGEVRELIILDNQLAQVSLLQGFA